MSVTVTVAPAQNGNPPVAAVQVVVATGASWSVDQQNRLSVVDTAGKPVALFGQWVYAQQT